MKKQKWIFILVILAFLTGCAKTKEFTYELPQITATLPVTKGITLGYVDLKVEGPVQESLNEVYSESPQNKINEIIIKEVKSTGLVDKVVVIPIDMIHDKLYLQQNNIDLVMASTLTEMKWEVPDYKAMQSKAFALSLFGGLVGGLIYGSTKTDVYGITKLDITLIDPDSNKICLDKEYQGRHEETKSKLGCDSGQTKSEVIGKSLKETMDQFKGDLTQVVAKLK